MRVSGIRVIRWLHLTVLGAALAAVLLVASGASLWHVDTPGSEATCAICHVAHLTPLLGAATGTLSAPLFIAWHQPAETQITHASPATLNAPPRAPPA
jgi:hypothetical protein